MNADVRFVFGEEFSDFWHFLVLSATKPVRWHYASTIVKCSNVIPGVNL